MTVNKKILTSTISILFLFTLCVGVAFAQAGAGGGGGGGGSTGSAGGGGSTGGNPSVNVNLPNPFSGGTSLFGLVKTIINDLVLPIGGILAVLAFVYSGFLYVTAQGNESKIKDAHKALLYTAVGTGVLLGAWVLANAICQTISSIGGPACPT